MHTSVSTLGLLPVLADLGLDPGAVHAAPGQGPAGHGAAGPRALLACVPAEERDAARGVGELAPLVAVTAGSHDHLLVLCAGERDDRELARWRDAFWPAHHLVAIYHLAHSGIVRRTLQGSATVRGGTGHHGNLLVLRPRSALFAREAVAQKFDLNAAGWNGQPGKPGYAHHRWMRRYVARFADPRGKRRLLDFGCGAGWVGIEAALLAGDAELAAFDPSPAMVEQALENARANGIAQCSARVGFGEDPPFPAQGEAAFDLVLSSGVISFSGEPARFADGLVRALAPGGRLVIGDLNPHSTGMLARRRTRALLPVRELNAPAREEVQALLEARGLVHAAWSGYQRTSPAPELLHWSGRHLGGLLDRPLLWWNERSAGPERPERFDSWVMRFERPPGA